ncbi:tol-pal system protein YbgF [Marinospirillum insulare]|uniref:Cell division coordinator CpoB n=1 Tax=Marinospirillum insulare TaxID=217169 RepID=A0ABQ5ZTT7_9GAMM|nr:tol-pal system protein YbgF [Marinospirillum insulare]GLR62846.1 tol-pal system protein YbgF [Marinospirillum insulare]
MKANQLLAKVREKVGAILAPRFLSTFSFLTFLTLATFTASSQADSRAVAVANAELLMQIEQMQQEIKALRNMVEQQENTLSKMQTEQRNRYLDLDQRAQEYAKRILALEETPISKPPSLPPADATATEELAKPSLGDQQAYNQAYAHVPEQRFDEAIASFQTFIREYPNSRLIGNAYYWLGEIYMAQNRTAEAEKMFDAVVNNHPSSFKIADSKYKLGLIYARYGNDKKAKQTMQQVIANHPREPAADLARNYLNK